MMENGNSDSETEGAKTEEASDDDDIDSDEEYYGSEDERERTWIGFDSSSHKRTQTKEEEDAEEEERRRRRKVFFGDERPRHRFTGTSDGRSGGSSRQDYPQRSAPAQETTYRTQYRYRPYQNRQYDYQQPRGRYASGYGGGYSRPQTYKYN